MSSTTNPAQTTTISSIMQNALIAGVIAGVINVIIFFLGGTLVGGIEFDMNMTGEFAPMPFFMPIVASLLPSLLAGIGLWVARRFIPRGNMVFIIGTAILTLLSLAGPFNGQIATQGASIVLASMHLVVGAVLMGYLAQR